MEPDGCSTTTQLAARQVGQLIGMPFDTLSSESARRRHR